ncbi:terminase family protein [Pseudoflavonifractor phocaeensis]|uniref:terminase large subunit domain-containing protein n=1 Tax=Pseudoflavonifractor phocaeensis TaxID=1870988 RepID=UPI00313E5DC4
MASNVLWSPQPKQIAFMRRGEYEGLYGGAAGGGKSDALVAEALRQVKIPHYKALILRKTFPQLSELIDKSLALYPKAFPGAKYNASAHAWTFPSGAKIRFGSMQYAKDRVQYQGHAYDFIAFDELTHFTWDEYSYLFSRNRPNGPGTRVYMRSTANPGGIGHGWVKERFITAGPPEKTIWEGFSVRFPDGHTERRFRSRVCVRASLFDNKKLLENDPNYIDNLSLMAPAERDALLYGNWDSFEGQVFTEWKNDPARYVDRVNTHVIAPFKVPESWAVWRGFDWGYSRPFSVGWYAVDQDRRLYRIRELYGCTGKANTGVKWEPGQVARRIREIEAQDPNLKGRRIHGVADPAIFNDGGMESVAALMEREGVYWDRGDHERISGKMQVHHRLAFDDGGIPMLYVFETCRHFIRTLPNLVYDQTDVEDVDTDGEDHIYDELRYVCMANPIAPRTRKAKPLVVYDPLGVDEPELGRYEWFRRG